MNYYIPYFEISAFIASVAAWHSIKQSKALRLFPLLLFIIIPVEIYEIYLKSSRQQNNAWIYNVQIPVQHFIYLAILYSSVSSLQTKTFIKWFMVAFVSFTIITLLFFTNSSRFNVLEYCFGSVLIIIGIVIKFYEMLQNPTEFNFLRNPFFYMLFAFLLFNVGTLPYFAMANWLYVVKGYKKAALVLANVMSILNYVLYTTYTIAFIWMMRMKATY